MTAANQGQSIDVYVGEVDRRPMQIELLGSVSLVTNGVRTEIRSAKVRAMLAALALESGRTVYYEELVQELWPNEIPKNPRNALQAHATRIRRTLDSGAGGSVPRVWLRAAHDGYVLDLAREFVDSHRFLDLTACGAAALVPNPLQAVRYLLEALALWRGPALINTRSGERCRGAAAFLEERRLLAGEDLAVARMLLGDHRQAAAELQRLMAAHPTREHLCELLMLALYRSGRQSEALHLFHRTKQHLSDELGVVPGRPLFRLYEDILAHHPALESPEFVLSRVDSRVARG